MRPRLRAAVAAGAVALLLGCDQVEGARRDLESDPVVRPLAPADAPALRADVTAQAAALEALLRAGVGPLADGWPTAAFEEQCFADVPVDSGIPTQEEGVRVGGSARPPAGLAPEAERRLADELVAAARAAGWQEQPERFLADVTVLVPALPPAPARSDAQRRAQLLPPSPAARGGGGLEWDTGCVLVG